MTFHPGAIDGVIWKPLRKYHDPRGWLCELFRHDELPPEFHPVMAYISMSDPGVARGPHEPARSGWSDAGPGGSRRLRGRGITTAMGGFFFNLGRSVGAGLRKGKW